MRGLKRAVEQVSGRMVAMGGTAALESSFGELVRAGIVTIGRFSYGTPTVVVYPGDTGKVAIGSFVAMAQDIEIFVGGEHPVEWVSTYPLRSRLDLPDALTDGLPRSKGDVVIGNDVWIGRGARILSGVRLGDGAVIGASSTVTSDVRPYAIAAGSPAREIRRRFADDVVDSLLAIAWWDWPEDAIRSAVPLLSSDRVDEFVRYAQARSAGAGGLPS